MRIFMSILGICSHMMLKDKGGVLGQTHKGFEQSSCKIATGLFGQTLHASTTRSERLVPVMGYTAGRPKAQRSLAQVPPGLQKFCGCKPLN